MKCAVCGREFAGSICPLCGFPVFSIPGDAEEAARKRRKMTKEYRDRFLKQVDVSIEFYRGREESGTVAFSESESRRVGSASELLGQTVWLSEMFARIPGAEKITVSVTAVVGAQNIGKTIEIPNLTEPWLQQLGFELRDDMRLILRLRDEAGNTAESGAEELFA